MLIINTETYEYPLTVEQVAALFPNTSFPVPFRPPDGYAEVKPTPVPAHDAVTQKVVELMPLLGLDGYSQTWQVVSRFVEYTDDAGITHTVVEQEAEAVAEHLARLRADRREAIKAEHERRTQQGGYQAAGKWFHSDTFSRSQQLGLVYRGSNIPEGLMWKTMDGTYVEMTQAMALLVFQAALISDRANFQYAESLKAQVDSSPDPSSVNILVGWPEIFKG